MHFWLRLPRRASSGGLFNHVTRRGGLAEKASGVSHYFQALTEQPLGAFEQRERGHREGPFPITNEGATKAQCANLSGDIPLSGTFRCPVSWDDG